MANNDFPSFLFFLFLPFGACVTRAGLVFFKRQGFRRTWRFPSFSFSFWTGHSRLEAEKLPIAKFFSPFLFYPSRIGRKITLGGDWVGALLPPFFFSLFLAVQRPGGESRQFFGVDRRFVPPPILLFSFLFSFLPRGRANFSQGERGVGRAGAAGGSPFFPLFLFLFSSGAGCRTA